MLQFHTAVFILISFTIVSDALPVRSYHEFKRSDDSISKTARNPSYAMNSVRQSNQMARRSFGNKERKFGSSDRSSMKRGLDIGVHVKIPTTAKANNVLEQLEDVLAEALGLEDRFNVSECPRCDEEGPVPEARANVRVKPAFECDEWNAKLRICILERNIGDTVTFYLSTGRSHRPSVTWMKEFHLRDSNKRQEVIIDPENCPENIIIGRRGYELRVSPITETDVGYNLFSASLNGHTAPFSKVFFMIRIVPIDLGFVYVGETIEMDLRGFVSLPAESMSFRWYIEKDGEHGTLPSNMRTAGSSIKISELRQEQEGILACIVYTNLDYMATKKRFLLKDLVNNNDVLKSSPDDTLVFKGDSLRDKRDPKKLVRLRDKRDPKKLVRHKREDNMPEKIEESLLETTTNDESEHIATHEAASHTYDYNLDMNSGEDGYDENLNNVPKTATDNDEYGFPEANGVNVDLRGDLPDVNQMDIVEESGPSEVEEHGTRLDAKQHQPIDAQLENRPQANGYASIKQSIAMNDIPENQNTLLQANGRSSNQKADSELYQKKAGETAQNRYIDSNIQGKDRLTAPQNKNLQELDSSEIARPRRMTAEDNIAKLISFCYTDYECSGSAICARTKAKEPGFCKCLPGSRGVGIFCRENIWLSNDFQIEELHSPDDFTISSPSMFI